jgi:DedD protein
MSLFNFRRGRPANASAKAAAPTKAAESVEVVRRRARQRLIGSALLVLLGVIGFPLIFETQPRPVPVDIAIEIPSRLAVKPGSPIAPVQRSEQAVATEAADAPVKGAPGTESAPPVPPQASLIDKEEIVEPRPQEPTRPAPKAEVKTEPAIPARPEPKPRPDEGQRARALLEGADPQAAGQADKRLVVQVGAFADEAKARETRARLEKAGLKTYTQVADTKDGKRIRVRVGPYESRAEAEKAATKIKSLNLPAAVLAL